MVYCEQEGKYLQRGEICEEIFLCQNFIGAISTLFIGALRIGSLF